MNWIISMTLGVIAGVGLLSACNSPRTLVVASCALTLGIVLGTHAEDWSG